MHRGSVPHVGCRSRSKGYSRISHNISRAFIERDSAGWQSGFMAQHESSILPLVAAAVASACFGASEVATRWIVGDAEPSVLAFLRYLIATACLALPMWALRRPGVDRQDRLPVGFLGVIFFGIFPWSFSAALLHLSAATGALILGLIPVLTMLLARLTGTESLPPSKLAGVALTVCGVALAFGTISNENENAWLGATLMLLSATCAAIYNVFSRRYIARGKPVSVASLALFLGTVGGALSFPLWTWALGRISSTQVAVFITLNPITAALLAMTMLDESPGAAFVPGLLAVGMGIALVNRREPAAVLRPTIIASGRDR